MGIWHLRLCGRWHFGRDINGGGQLLVIRARLWRAELQIRKLGKKNTQSLEKETNQAMLHSPDI